MSYYIATDRFGNYDLAHHGIKGQRWGIRRYQNEDGSLTAAGEKRYSNGVSGLNKLDRDIVKAKYQKAKNLVKIEKANMKGKKEKVEKLKQKDKELSKSIRDGEKETERLLKSLKSKGYSINSKESMRYAKAGNTVAAAILLSPAGLAIYGGVQAVKYYRHGSENIGFVKGTRYSLNSEENKKK